jgi:hypothetical protein
MLRRILLLPVLLTALMVVLTPATANPGNGSGKAVGQQNGPAWQSWESKPYGHGDGRRMR